MDYETAEGIALSAGLSPERGQKYYKKYKKLQVFCNFLKKNKKVKYF